MKCSVMETSLDIPHSGAGRKGSVLNADATSILPALVLQTCCKTVPAVIAYSLYCLSAGTEHLEAAMQ